MTQLDMLQNTDFALWLRANANLLLAEVTPEHDHQDKLKFATEALRIVEELQRENSLDRDAFWTEEYNRLERDARECLERTKKQEDDYKQAVEEHEDNRLEGSQDDGMNDGLLLRWISVGCGEDVADDVGAFGVGGMFGTGTGSG